MHVQKKKLFSLLDEVTLRVIVKARSKRECDVGGILGS